MDRKCRARKGQEKGKKSEMKPLYTENMLKKLLTSLALACAFLSLQGQVRNEKLLKEWEFRKDHECTASGGWETVRVPHDWAISGPFDRDNDLQTVAVIQNGETVPTEKNGRSGALPYMGKGCYRTHLNVEKLEGRSFNLLFDGAMSEARVFVNGEKVCEWPYGYNAFHCDITSSLHEGDNLVTVLLENQPFSSRWYPGAGLYRKVRLIETSEIHVPVWGICVRTPHVEKEYAVVNLSAEIVGAEGNMEFDIETRIVDGKGNIVSQKTDRRKNIHESTLQQNLTLNHPELWSPENPSLYTAVTKISHDGRLLDSLSTRFGVRSVEFIADKGFFLNGERRVIHGVCQHHDLGPLGAAVNRSALRHQLEMLKDMGCDAIRTSHNMPAEDLAELCDEMGFMLMPEAFDEWDVAKCQNGYHRFFADWAEKDIVNMVRHFRNSPSVIMWSIGNEVPTQRSDDGYRTASRLQAICHREDPTRQVTCGMDQYGYVVSNGFASVMDVPGFNYKPRRYLEAYSKLPQNVILGSETASTVSSRGVYHLPSESGVQGIDALLVSGKRTADHQCSSYDTDFCPWSNIPDVDFAADEDYPWMAGQFVWTGFDYLGEPTPYDTASWPNHSSMFGIIDLASIPKDRFWLYRSQWNRESPTLHVVPHWTWPGHEGENIPVEVYTSYNKAELFVNGVSQGIMEKSHPVAADTLSPIAPDSQLMRRFRLVWPSVIYEKGELKVVAYNDDGTPAMEQTVRTAGKPYALKLVPYIGKDSVDGFAFPAVSSPEGGVLPADGEELCYINVSVVDRDGNPVPSDSRLVKVSVGGVGSFEAVANGDPTCLESFKKPQMHLFSGQMTVIVRSGSEPGKIPVSVSAKGVRSAKLVMECL